MEKFMLIFQGGGPSENASPEFMQAQMGKWMAWIEKLTKAGKYVSGEPLLPGGKLIKGKSKTVGGFFILNAENYDEAVKLCDDYPDYEHGSIQVRQVMKMDM
jgi:hypothetical protein